MGLVRSTRSVTDNKVLCYTSWYMSKSILSFLIFIALVLIVLFTSYSNREVYLPEPVSLASSTPAVSVDSKMNVSDVKKHNNQSSCWTIVKDSVYDLTSFVSKHSGGSSAILSLCGVDGTAAFIDQHGNQRRPNNELVGLKIGDLMK